MRVGANKFLRDSAQDATIGQCVRAGHAIGVTFMKALPILPIGADVSRPINIGQVSSGPSGTLNDRNRVATGLSGFGLESLKADMAEQCLDCLLFKISIHELPFRTVPNQMSLPHYRV